MTSNQWPTLQLRLTEMRAVSRVIGGVLILSGIGFLTIFGYESAIGGWSSGLAGWLTGAIFVGGGSALILAGRYYLRLHPGTPDEPRPSSKITGFALLHRHQLKVIAQTGAVWSLVHFGAVCGGTDWLGSWFLWPLGTGAIFLQLISSKIAEPAGGANPRWSMLIQTVAPVGTLLLLVLICWQQWSGQAGTSRDTYHRIGRIAANAFIALLYALEALFFARGEAPPESQER